MKNLTKTIGFLFGMMLLNGAYAATDLFLSSNEGALTPTEKTGWANWAKGYNMATDNWGNSWVLHYYKYESTYWAYVATEDVGIVNNALLMCKKVYDANNERARQIYFITGNEPGGLPTAEIIPGWPHDQFYIAQTSGGQTVHKGDAGSTACGAFYYAVAARMIMETPSIWDSFPPSPHNGKTYREWAEYYVNDGVYTLNGNFMKYFVDPVTHEIRYQFSDPDNPSAVHQLGNFSAFNRAGMAALPISWMIVAMEEMGIHSASRDNYKDVVNAFLDSWINDSMITYSSGGHDMLDFPYRWQPELSVNNQRSEDIGHGGYDVWQFQGIYRTGQYPQITEDIWTRLANTMVYNVQLGPGSHAYRLDGSGSYGSSTQPEMFRLLSRWHADMRTITKRWDPAQAVSRGAEEAQIQVRINGGSWQTTKSFHVDPGDTVEMNGVLPDLASGWSWTGPNGFSSTSRLVTLSNVNSNVNGTYTVSHGTIENYIRLVVINLAPQWTTNLIVETDAMEDVAYSGSIASYATDVDGQPLSFSKGSGPAWLNVATNGALSGTPVLADVGPNNWTVQVTDGIDTNSATLSINVYYANGEPLYPSSSGDNSFYEWISNVTVGSSIDRSSGDDDGYFDATAFSTTGAKGESIPFSLAKGVLEGESSYSYYWRIWIDLNHDGDFVDTDELVYSLSVASSNVVADSFIVPFTYAYMGPTRMRVSMKWEGDGVPTSEEIFPYGEVEDYTIHIISNTAPVFTSNPVVESNAMENVVYNESLANDATDADGHSLNFSKVSGPAWLDIATNGALSGTPVLADVGPNNWTVQVTDGIDTNSTTLSINVYYANGEPLYPSSSGSDSSYEWISNVAIGTINRSSSDDGGYFDATTFSTTESKGSTISFSLTKGLLGGESYSYYWRIWIDLNHDGDFVDADELVYSTPVASSNSVADSFVLPSTFSFTGPTRMRVSMKWDADGVPTSTETFPYGEVEDYTINITDSNSAPLFDSDPVVELSATKGAAYNSTIADDASDGDDDSMSFDKVSGPSWLSVAGSGVLSGTPIASDIGSNSWSILVTDGVATNTGTLEILVNSDGDWDDDGIPDAWELDYFGHETNAVGSLDSDEDGQNNEAEFIAGFDPTNPASFFAITGFDMPAGTSNAVIDWIPASGRIYDALWANSLTGNFSTVVSDMLYPQGSCTVEVNQVEDAGFYKIEVRLAP